MTLDGGQTEIIEVDNGTFAVEVARRELPELIFLDWSMPGPTPPRASSDSANVTAATPPSSP